MILEVSLFPFSHGFVCHSVKLLLLEWKKIPHMKEKKSWQEEQSNLSSRKGEQTILSVLQNGYGFHGLRSWYNCYKLPGSKDVAECNPRPDGLDVLLPPVCSVFWELYIRPQSSSFKV